MTRSVLHRAGGLFLFVAWIQVATANALPCALSCLLEANVAHHHHPGVDEDHAIGHHASGAKISSPENCGVPQLMVVAFMPPEFPTPPSVTVALVHTQLALPSAFLSAVPEFATPPPRV
jgi:hypothetical protein